MRNDSTYEYQSAGANARVRQLRLVAMAQASRGSSLLLTDENLAGTRSSLVH